MAEERRPFRFVIPPAEAQSFSQPGPYLFPHYQNYNYQALPTAVPHFVAATPPGNTPTSAASSSENSDNSPSEVGSKRCPNWSDAETRFLLQNLARLLGYQVHPSNESPPSFKKYSENQHERSKQKGFVSRHFSKLRRLVIGVFSVNSLDFTSENTCPTQLVNVGTLRRNVQPVKQPSENTLKVLEVRQPPSKAITRMRPDLLL